MKNFGVLKAYKGIIQFIDICQYAEMRELIKELRDRLGTNNALTQLDALILIHLSMIQLRKKSLKENKLRA
jgi:hypothetical protein